MNDVLHDDGREQPNGQANGVPAEPSLPVKHGHGGRRPGAGRPLYELSAGAVIRRTEASILAKLPNLVRQLMWIADNGQPGDRLRAVTYLLDRVLGRAPQATRTLAEHGPAPIQQTESGVHQLMRELFHDCSPATLNVVKQAVLADLRAQGKLAPDADVVSIEPADGRAPPPP